MFQKRNMEPIPLLLFVIDHFNPFSLNRSGASVLAPQQP